jgi:hypothetical protein
MTNANERLKIVQYMVDVREYIEKVDAEIERILPQIDYNVESYRKYKRLLGEREEVRQQIRDCSEVLTNRDNIRNDICTKCLTVMDRDYNNGQ